MTTIIPHHLLRRESLLEPCTHLAPVEFIKIGNWPNSLGFAVHNKAGYALIDHTLVLSRIGRR